MQVFQWVYGMQCMEMHCLLDEEGGEETDWAGRSHMSIHWLHRLLLGRMRRASRMIRNDL